MYRGEVVIVTQPELKRGLETGTEFAVCRAVIEREEFRRNVGANVTVSTFIGITAFDAMANDLLGLNVRDRVKVVGNLTEQAYIGKDGQPATDLKLLLQGVSAPVAAVQEETAVNGQYAAGR